MEIVCRRGRAVLCEEEQVTLDDCDSIATLFLREATRSSVSRPEKKWGRMQPSLNLPIEP